MSYLKTLVRFDSFCFDDYFTGVLINNITQKGSDSDTTPTSTSTQQSFKYHVKNDVNTQVTIYAQGYLVCSISFKMCVHIRHTFCNMLTYSYVLTANNTKGI